MKRWKKIALVLLLLVAASQIPFCYRRLQLGATQQKINELNANRINRESENFRTVVGVIHVHTSLGGHSAGSFNELINAANGNNLDFVLLTEHPSPLYDTARQTLNGFHNGVLFVGGNEISSKQGDRFLVLPGDAESSKDTTQNTDALLARQKAAGRLALVTYPEKYRAWDAAREFDGVEVYSLHTDAKRFPRFLAFFDFFWSFPAFPELAMARYFSRPDENLRKFDEITASGKRATLFGAADAHSNIGISFGDRAGHDLLKIHLDPYENVFRLVRLHVLLENGKELTQENLLKAIADGHCYLAFDVYGEARGFDFFAAKSADIKTMGDEIAFGENLRLTARSPVPARFVLFRNGQRIAEFAEATEINFDVREPGVYRVEAYLDAIGLNRAPWIISNPIYVR
jgi:hypothetical protein